MNGKTMRYAGTAVLMIFIAAGAYLIGYKTAYDRMERAAASYETETFYAAITDISDSSITVQGMEINDINFRGRFTFPVMEETSYLWRGTRISPKDLEKGIIFRLPLRDWYGNCLLYTSPSPRDS